MGRSANFQARHSNCRDNHHQLHHLPQSDHQNSHHHHHHNNNNNRHNYIRILPLPYDVPSGPISSFFQITTPKEISITTNSRSINISVITHKHAAAFFIAVVLFSSYGDARISNNNNNNNHIRSSRIQRASKQSSNSAKSTSSMEQSAFTLSSNPSNKTSIDALRPTFPDSNGSDSAKKLTRPQLTKLLISTLQKLHVLKESDISCILLDEIVNINNDLKSPTQSSNMQYNMTIYMYFRELNTKPSPALHPTKSTPIGPNVNIHNSNNESVTMLHLSCVSDPTVDVRMSTVNNLADGRQNINISHKNTLIDSYKDNNKSTDGLRHAGLNLLTEKHTGRNMSVVPINKITDGNTGRNMSTNRSALTVGHTDINGLTGHADIDKLTGHADRDKLTGHADRNKLTNIVTDKYTSAAYRAKDSSTTPAGIQQGLQSGVLSRIQIVVISTCSTIIGTFFLVAGIMRARNYIKRYRLEQELARRPKFRSCSVALRGATHSLEQLRRDSLTSRSSNQEVPRCLLTKKSNRKRKARYFSQGHPAEISSEGTIYMEGESSVLSRTTEISKISTPNGMTTRGQIQGSINPSFSSGSISYQLRFKGDTPDVDQRMSVSSNNKSGKKSQRKHEDKAREYNQLSSNDLDERVIPLKPESQSDKGRNTCDDKTAVELSPPCNRLDNLVRTERFLEHPTDMTWPSFVDRPPTILREDLNSSNSELQSNSPRKSGPADSPTDTTHPAVLNNSVDDVGGHQSEVPLCFGPPQLFCDLSFFTKSGNGYCDATEHPATYDICGINTSIVTNHNNGHFEPIKLPDAQSYELNTTFVTNHNNEYVDSFEQPDLHDSCLATTCETSQNDRSHKYEDSSNETEIMNIHEVCDLNNLHLQLEQVDAEPHHKTPSPPDSSDSSDADLEGGTTNTDLFTCSSLTSIKSSVDSLESDEQPDVDANNKSLLGYENNIPDLFAENSCLVNPPIYDSSV